MRAGLIPSRALQEGRIIYERQSQQTARTLDGIVFLYFSKAIKRFIHYMSYCYHWRFQRFYIFVYILAAYLASELQLL